MLALELLTDGRLLAQRSRGNKVIFHIILTENFSFKHLAGVVASSASDWGLDLATYPMTIMIGGLGIGTALMGKWAAKVGPRRAMIQGCSIAGLGYLGAGAGILHHNIPPPA